MPPNERKSRVVLLNEAIQKIFERIQQGVTRDSESLGMTMNNFMLLETLITWLKLWWIGITQNSHLLFYPEQNLLMEEEEKTLDSLEQNIIYSLSEANMNNIPQVRALAGQLPIGNPSQNQLDLNAEIGQLESMGGFYINTIRNWYNRSSSPSFYE